MLLILIILVIVIIIILSILYYFLRKYYHFIYLRNKIFPIEISNIELNTNIEEEKNYQRIMNVLFRRPTYDEIIFLLKYKKFIDMPNVYSVCNYQKVNQMKNLLIDVINKNIKGCLVETGVWRGGMGMWMKCILKYYRDKRGIWLFDTFEYFPNPSHEKDSKINHLTNLLFEKMPSIDDVKKNFKKYNLLDESVHFIKGEFTDTLCKVPIHDISILRLDSDYYDSTMLVLNTYYWKISKGGYVIVDDYGNTFLACKNAVDDFRLKNNIELPIINKDGESIYWRIE